MRAVTLAALALTGALSYGIYELKYEVVALEGSLAELNRQLINEREAIHVMNAEWSYLNRPERLQDLASRYLDLGPAVVYSLEGLEKIPARGASATDGDVAEFGMPPLPRSTPAPKPVPVPHTPLLASTGSSP